MPVVDSQRSTSCFVLDADMVVWLKERRTRLQVDSISLVVRQILRAAMEAEQQPAAQGCTLADVAAGRDCVCVIGDGHRAAALVRQLEPAEAVG